MPPLGERQREADELVHTGVAAFKSESALSRARALLEEGQLREALRALNGVRPGDSLRSEADLLRSAVQRALLAGSGEPADEVGVDRVSGER